MRREVELVEKLILLHFDMNESLQGYGTHSLTDKADLCWSVSADSPKGRTRSRRQVREVNAIGGAAHVRGPEGPLAVLSKLG